MAVRTLQRGVFVDHDLLAFDNLGLLVALVAGHVGVTAGERQMRLVVVKARRLPARHVMAVSAVGGVVFGQELSIVGVFVTRFAFLRCALEARLGWRGRFVAVSTRDRSVRSQEREFRFRVVEAINIAPGFGAVAGFATEVRAVCSLARHLPRELTLVRVLMTGSTSTIFKLEGKYFVGASGKANLVAIRTSDGRVSAGEGESCVAVLGNRIGGTMPVDNGVAVFAAVPVRCGSKLVVVCVFVAVGAGRELHFVDGVFAGRSVTLCALYFEVFAL